MLATEHAPRGPFQILERLHGLADIFKRRALVLEERPRVIHVRRELGADFFLPPEFLARKRDPEAPVPPWLLNLLACLTRSRLRWLFAFSGLSGFVMTTLRVEKYAFHAVLMMFLGAFGQLLIVLGVH